MKRADFEESKKESHGFNNSANEKPHLKRQSWMMEEPDSLFKISSVKEKISKRSEEQPYKISSRELNPDLLAQYNKSKLHEKELKMESLSNKTADALASEKRRSKSKHKMDSLKDCDLCLNSESLPIFPLLSTGYRAYLGIPMSKPLVSESMLIVPHEHFSCTLDCGDDEWDEIRNYMKSIIKMAHSMNKGVIFTETAINLNNKQHCFIECFPLPYDLYDVAPAYFKQEILLSGPEWAQHKRLMHTHEKGFRRSMVKELSYFHVWFGLEKSFGTVIEDEDFGKNFGQMVIAGILNKGIDRWKNAKPMSKVDLKASCEALKKKFSPFDWAKDLHRK